MRKFICLIGILISGHHALPQRIENLKALVVNKVVEIHYDLIETAIDQTFDVLLFSSVNKFTQPLERVSGDLGKDIKPGKGKVIQWMPESELIKFRGEVVFEIQVKVFLPFVSIATPAKDAVIKRGTTRIIEWTGANANTKLQLDLYHDEVKLASIESTDNTGKLKWSVPSSLKPGTNYKILIFDSNKSDNRAFSSPFLIKRKIPTALKVSISVLGAGIVGYLLSNLPNGGTKAPSKLPSPPDVN